MPCFSFGWLEDVLIWLVIICAVVMVLRIVIPWALGALGIGIDARATMVINIILGAIILIYVIVILFDLAGCLIGSGGMHLPRRS